MDNSRNKPASMKAQSKTNSTVMNDDDFHNKTRSSFLVGEKSKEKTLKLDDTGFRAPQTRTEMYNELAKKEKSNLDKDYYDLASPVSRIISLFVDVAFVALLLKVSLLIVPLELTVVQLFLDKYKLQLILSDSIMSYVCSGINLILSLFTLVIIPIAFFNTSLGKKITGIRVRGDKKYTLSISQAFIREFIYKPISIISVIGFILPFFDKKRKSLHDKFSGTFVVKD